MAAVLDIGFISALAWFLLHVLPARAAPSCYMLNGDLATSQFQPCTNNLPPGSNSACCNLGKSPPDICLGGGLCQRMDSTEGNFAIYAVGCTDRTGKDSACPQYCPNKAQFYSLNPCFNGTVSSWCCNDQVSSNSCCVNNSGAFAFNLTTLGVSSTPSQSTPAGTTASANSCSNTGASKGKTASCSVKKSTIIGSSIGAFFAGNLIAGLLAALYFAARPAKKQNQKAMSHHAAHVTPATDWRRELDASSPSSIIPPRPDGRIFTQEIGGQEVGAGTFKHEIDGRQVGNLT